MGELIRKFASVAIFGHKFGYLPVEDADHTIFSGKSYHAVIRGPRGLDFSKTTHFRSEAEDLKALNNGYSGCYRNPAQKLTSLT